MGSFQAETGFFAKHQETGFFGREGAFQTAGVPVSLVGWIG